MNPVSVLLVVLGLLSGPVFAESDKLNNSLYEAVNAFDTAEVKSLLERGADPNSVYPTGLTSLMRAVEINQASIVRELLKGGADSNLRDRNGRSTAEIAIESGNPEIVEALLKGGADFNVTDSYGSSMVLIAVMSGRPSSHDLVAAMGRHGVNMNAGTASQTPLYHAVEQGDRKMVEILLQAGADPSLATETGGLPLNSALSRPKILDMLLKAGADPDGVDRFKNPVLFNALFSGSTEAAEALVKAGADINQPGADGRTAIRRASDGGAEEIVKFLERYGAIGGKKQEKLKSAKQAKAPAARLPAHDEYPRVESLPVYPGAETMVVMNAETHTASYLTADSLAKVAKTTTKILENAGWKEANHPHNKRKDDQHYVMFVKGEFLLITDISIARAMGNKTAITYNIGPLNSSFGRMIK